MDAKVIVVQGGEELLAALAKILGSEVAAQVGLPAPVDPCEVCEEPCDEEEFEVECDESCKICNPEPDFAFGEVISTETDEFTLTRVYSVIGADDLDVTVTDAGVVVSGMVFDTEYEIEAEFENTIAEAGAYDEVTAYYNSDDDTLTVELTKVGPEGAVVEIENWM